MQWLARSQLVVVLLYYSLFNHHLLNQAIATPNERASLDLTSLKELTNTTLGGRGTFPNGPDVLAINIYKTAGADVLTNIILRWGEAQA